MAKRVESLLVLSGRYPPIWLLAIAVLGTGCGEASPKPLDTTFDAGNASTANPSDTTTNPEPVTAGTNADSIANTAGNTEQAGGASGTAGGSGTGSIVSVDASVSRDGATSVAGSGGSLSLTDASTPPEQEPQTTPTEPSADSVVPDTPYCAPVADWDPAWAAFEEEVVVLTNQHRAQGADCASGSYPPVEPLTMNPHLRCAARVHSMDMAERDFYDHFSPEGTSPFQRMAEAGYSGGQAENISYGQSTPQQAVQGWMDSDGHCVNIMRSSLSEIGVGFYDGSTPGQWPPQKMWTQTFGSPGWW